MFGIAFENFGQNNSVKILNITINKTNFNDLETLNNEINSFITLH